MSKRILLVGYYGKANFGDDLLLRITYRLCREYAPDATIYVIVDGNRGEYLATMLPDAVVLPPGRHGEFDMIVHGGGGVFFDFARYDSWQRAAEFALKLIGFKAYLMLEKMLRILCNKKRSSTKVRVGLGIGVGTYSPGSPRLRERLPILADFAALWVRDRVSALNLKRFSGLMKAEIIPGSDLVFLTEYWQHQTIVPSQHRPGEKPKLGIALRDWPLASMKAEILTPLLAKLTEKYVVTGFILDAAADTEVIQILAPYTRHFWQPNNMRVEDFAAHLATQDVLLTSRAHAAICGACVGVPSVIIEIESKLQEVAAMLPQSSVLVDANDTTLWSKAIDQALHLAPEKIAQDCSMNHEASTKALARVSSYFP